MILEIAINPKIHYVAVTCTTSSDIESLPYYNVTRIILYSSGAIALFRGNELASLFTCEVICTPMLLKL